MSDRYGVVANVINDRALRTGAKVYIVRVNGDAEFPKVYGMSKSGRMIEKYMPFKRLENFRAAWIPDHLMSVVGIQATKDQANNYADRLTEMWSDVRFFNRDGRLVKDGISSGKAFRL